MSVLYYNGFTVVVLCEGSRLPVQVCFQIVCHNSIRLYVSFHVYMLAVSSKKPSFCTAAAVACAMVRASSRLGRLMRSHVAAR